MAGGPRLRGPLALEQPVHRHRNALRLRQPRRGQHRLREARRRRRHGLQFRAIPTGRPAGPTRSKLH
jgi:hypothetical protein